MKQLIIFIAILLILIIIIKFKKPIKENFYEEKQWWDRQTQNKKNINDITKERIDNDLTDNTLPGYYIETSSDNFNDVRGTDNGIESNKIKINYGNKENEEVIKKYGSYAEETSPEYKKPNFNFSIDKTYKAKEDVNSPDYRIKDLKNFSGEESVTDLLNKSVIAYGEKYYNGLLPVEIDQGKFMRNWNSDGKVEGNIIEGRSSQDLFSKIKTLDDYYKYQILKKKNKINHNDAEDIVSKNKLYYDDRFQDLSTNVWYDGQNYKCIEEGEYKEDNSQSENALERKCVKHQEEVPIQLIGYSDLFGKPHIFQGNTDNLVSRSLYSDNGEEDDKSYDGAKCIKNSSCCSGNKECYPSVEDGDDFVPQFVSASLKPCPLGLKNKYIFEKPTGEGQPEAVTYFSNIGGFYTDDDYEGFPKEGKKATSLNKNAEGFYKDGYQKCIACDFQAGCRFDEQGRPRDTHFEAQSCINGNNRICKPCRVCGMGKEFIEVGCGEGGITQDTVCAICTPCKEDHYKVSGCTNFNSYFDNHCVKMTDCLGEPQEDDDYTDPGKGNYQYESKKGYPGSYMEKNGKEIGSGPLKGESETEGWIDGEYIGGEILRDVEGDKNSAYLGKDRQCKKCDICPEGTKNIGGCKGKNSTSNSTCQRIIPVKKYIYKNYSCKKGNYFNKEILKYILNWDDFDFINGDFEEYKNTKETNFKEKIGLDITDKQKEMINRLKEFYKKDRDIRENIKKDIDSGTKEGSDINNLEIYNKKNPVINFTDDEIKNVACVPCRECPSGTYTNPENPGCEKDRDTVCIEKTKCNSEFEIIANEGDHKTDRTCGPCKCPEDKYGTAICSDGKIISGCENRTPCASDEYQFDQPPKYNDTTRNTRCNKCSICPPNSFKLAECNKNTDTVCKIHKKCDPKSQYVIKKGTDISDTICKCLDGFELPKDDFGYPILDSNFCVPNKGECWKGPCNSNAKCYDRFDDEGKFESYQCICNENEGYMNTEKNGVGPGGCRKIPENHKHELEGLGPADDYGLGEKINNIMTHIDGDYHLELNGKHIHKNRNRF